MVVKLIKAPSLTACLSVYRPWQVTLVKAALWELYTKLHNLQNCLGNESSHMV